MPGRLLVAQGAFVGIGAYTTALLMHIGVPFPLCFVASGLVCFAIGWCARLSGAARAAPLSGVRHAGLYRAGLPRHAQRGMAYRRHLRPEQHRSARPARLVDKGPLGFYYFSFGILVVLAAATWWMLRSPWGRAFVALRENPIRALSLGLDTRRYTLMAFAIGSQPRRPVRRGVRAAGAIHRAAVVRARSVAQSCC